MLQDEILLLTGIPRSGTTLAASLVDSSDRVLCLNEPPRHYTWTLECRDSREFVQRVLNDLSRTRESLARGEAILDRRGKDGRIPTNYFNEHGERRALEYVPVRRPGAGAGLLLALKHNEPLTSVLPELCSGCDLRVIAIIRHPIPTILSWQSRQIPLRTGKLSLGYKFWQDALEVPSEGAPICDIQAKIFELYCQRYWALRDRLQILKYEDLVANPELLQSLTGRKATEGTTLGTQNHRLACECAPERLAELRQALVRHLKTAYRFYPDLDRW